VRIHRKSRVGCGPMCPPARAKHQCQTHKRRIDGVGPNKIWAERSEQESDRETEQEIVIVVLTNQGEIELFNHNRTHLRQFPVVFQQPRISFGATRQGYVRLHATHLFVPFVFFVVEKNLARVLLSTCVIDRTDG